MIIQQNNVSLVHEHTNKHLLTALLLGVALHGMSVFFTLENTYDALIHLFFADHYAGSWFEPWEPRWYTGFTVMSYPPLVHQLIALCALVGGLKFGLFAVAILCVVLFITGVYRFATLLTNNSLVGGYAALVAVFSSSFIESLHVFGQLPGIMAISVLMHALPPIYRFLRTGRLHALLSGISLIAVTVASHHVTGIFGMIFFIFPIIGTAIVDAARETAGSLKAVDLKVFFLTLAKHTKRIVLFVACALFAIIFCILPYWLNSKSNPINQVPIPHGSRDNFFEVSSSGFVFFVIPWGILLFLLPYFFYRYFSKRYVFFGLSLSLLFLLGTGGTTPIPFALLGENMFNILTMDRFTFWATVMVLPVLGEFTYRLVQGDLYRQIVAKSTRIYHRVAVGLLACALVFFAVFTINLSYFRPAQPAKIKMLPILNFLNQDQHDQWRFLTLGFGDQMAWLSAQTRALTVDGNYHSARVLPELTSKAVERLENSKFRGLEGIGSLQQFLTVPEKYNLKYIFSNDKFYDPLLFFSGWQRLRQLENGINVWERINIPVIPKLQHKKDVPLALKIMWGVVPLLALLLAFVCNIWIVWLQRIRKKPNMQPLAVPQTLYRSFSRPLLYTLAGWFVWMSLCTTYGFYLFYIRNAQQISPKNTVKAYYNAIDFNEFEKAYSFVAPESDLTLQQYMLDLAVTDGLLSSYAKLNTITLDVEIQAKNRAKVVASTEWITALEAIPITYEHELIKKKGKWYLLLPNDRPMVPPDEYFSSNTTVYFNQGRRHTTTEQTYHEDVLKQPVLEVLAAKLIKEDNQYVLIGELQNIDNVPADVVVTANLYGAKNNLLASFNAKYLIKHKLMPKETTSFKVYFEGVAWSENKSAIPQVFNPEEYTGLQLDETPVAFDLRCTGNVAQVDLYKKTTLNALERTDSTLRGTLLNSGTSEVTVPQLLVSYYNANKELVAVDHLFVKEGIRQQRKIDFEYPLQAAIIGTCITSSLSDCYVNGLPNQSIARKVLPNRNPAHALEQLLPIKGRGYEYIKIELNNFVANPN